MVLNSLAEEKLQASLRCLARHGRFLEIGKYDLSNNSPLGQYSHAHTLPHTPPPQQVVAS